MTFTLFAGDPCYGGEGQLSLPYFFPQTPLTTSSLSKSSPAADSIAFVAILVPPTPRLPPQYPPQDGRPHHCSQI